jgi:hypothetical protein
MNSTEAPNERRSAPRQLIGSAQSLVKLRLGREVAVLNTSRSGILIEGRVRLQPGGRIELQQDSPAGYVPVHVARCEVSLLDEHGVIYRAGLAFAEPLAVAWCGNGEAGPPGDEADL